MKAILLIMRIIPQNLLSYIVGWITRIPLPNAINRLWLLSFVKLFRIDMSEAEKPLHEFATIEDVFTRSIKPELRPIASEVVSPADGVISQSQAVSESGMAIQAKGLEYSVSELVFGSQPSNPDFIPGWYVTVYLAPHNYHRVHSPVSGTLQNIYYHPGRLWPVNNPFVKYLPRLFNVNERLTFDLLLASGHHCYVVMVGATNVGRISSPFCEEFVTNSLKRQIGITSEVKFPHGLALDAGDELGTFMLGSTAIVVFDKRCSFTENMVRIENGKQFIKMGESILS